MISTEPIIITVRTVAAATYSRIMYPEFNIAYGEDVAPFYYQERDEFQRIIFGGPVRTHGP